MGTGVDAGCQYDDEKGWVCAEKTLEIVHWFIVSYFFRKLSPPTIIGSLDSPYEHDYLYRTQSEDSPKSPLDMSYIKPSCGYMMTTAEVHSRTSSRQSQLETSRSDTMSTDNFFIDSYHSQDSANTLRSADMNFSSSMNSQDNVMHSRRASHTLQTEPIFIGRNELEQIRVPRSGQSSFDFESHSLPRRTCIHHNSEEYHTHSLPRREHHHHYLHEHNDPKMSNGSIAEADGKRRLSISFQDAQPSYVNVVPDTYSLSRRSSAHLQHQLVPSLALNLHHQHHYQQPLPHPTQLQQQVAPPTEELCSTCSSETESSSEDEEESGSETEQEEDDEKEIFIDFKPRLSPTPGLAKKKKKLAKAEDNEKGKQSASEEDSTQTPTNVEYANTQIHDGDILRQDKISRAPPDASTTSNRYSRETLRKRSVSLEDPLADVEITKKSSRSLKPNGSSPGSPDRKSSFASSDDVTRDHSDGNWNESQATILPRPPRWESLLLHGGRIHLTWDPFQFH